MSRPLAKRSRYDRATASRTSSSLSPAFPSFLPSRSSIVAASLDASSALASSASVSLRARKERITSYSRSDKRAISRPGSPRT
jgi:hypothetical protein